jgi:hypothetical protein
MSKKVYLILGAILVLIIVVGGIVFYLAKSKVTPTTSTIVTTTGTGTTGTTSTTGTGSSTTGTGSTTTGATTNTSTGTGTSTTGTTAANNGLVKRTTDQVVAPILSFNGNYLWYFTQAGSLNELTLATASLQRYPLPQTLNINYAVWATQGSDFIISGTASGSTTRAYYYYNSTAKTFTKYPAQVEEVQFMPSGNQVVYIWNNGNGTSSLSIADTNLGNHKQLVSSMPDLDDAIVVSPLGDHLLAYNASAPTNGKLYLMAFSDGKLHTIKTNVENQGVWSTDGQHFVFNKYNAAAPSDATLWLGSITSSSGDISMNISPAPSKIVFNTTGSNMYYAAADSNASSATANNDSTSNQPILLPDSLWSYNIATGSKTEIFSGDTNNLNVSDLMISNDESTLYFRNSDGYVYSVPVKGASAPASSSSGTSTSGS